VGISLNVRIGVVAWRSMEREESGGIGLVSRLASSVKQVVTVNCICG
jgi:hypothetical protein